MRISIGPFLSAVLVAGLVACAPDYPPPPPGFEPGLPVAWKDFTGAGRSDAVLIQARDGCVLEGNRWASDRLERTMTPAAQMSGYAPSMMGAIDQGRLTHIINCMRTAGWEPAG